VQPSGASGRPAKTRWSWCEEPPGPGPVRNARVKALDSICDLREGKGEAHRATLERVASTASQSAFNGWFKWTSVPHSIGVGSRFGDTSMQATVEVCQIGLGPVRWGLRARKHSLSGIPLLTASVLALNTTCGAPLNSSFKDRLGRACPRCS
jgi:hypothetical protein